MECTGRAIIKCLNHALAGSHRTTVVGIASNPFPVGLHGFNPTFSYVLQVIKLISKVIADFANGEISQASSLFDTEVSLQQYSDKSFYKTASLIAASCRSSAVFSGMDEDQKQAMYDYGKHLGLAFQVSFGWLADWLF